MNAFIINNDLTAMEGVTEVPFKFEYDSSSGKYGYRDGADTFRPFNDGSGGSVPVLLWENPSTGAGTAFQAQTISLDLSSYKYIILDYYNSSLYNRYFQRAFFEVGDSRIQCSSFNFDGSWAYGMRRNISIATSGITFGTGYWNQNVDDESIFPLRIWGCESAPTGDFPIVKIAGYTFNYSGTTRSSSNTPGFKNFTATLNGTTIYSGTDCFSQSNKKYSLYTESEGTKITEGAYSLEIYVQTRSSSIDMVLAVNGAALYSKNIAAGGSITYTDSYIIP